MLGKLSETNPFIFGGLIPVAMATNLARVKLAVKNVERFDGSQDFDAWFRDFIAMLDAFVVEDADRYEALVLVLDSGIRGLARG